MKRKTLLFLVILFCYNNVTSQEKEFKFNTKFYDAVNKWVVFPKNEKDSIYHYGFIYIDEQTGITFRLINNFKIKNELLLSSKKIKEASSLAIYRLNARTSNVYILNNKDLKQLNHKQKPKWLDIYKIDTTKITSLQKIGYHYNHVGASKKAIPYLLKAYRINPHNKGLEFELAYAYNATKQYKKSINILNIALKNNPKNFYFYRELGFAQRYLNKISDAEKTYLKGISASNNNFEKSEMAVNMAQAYFMLKNNTKFQEWKTLTKKYSKENSRYYKMVELMSEKLKAKK
ncbi:MAG: tetratricopeptide repeat protein [Flavobacteriaceae bacterium]